jgi:beta-phosphoglucomutase-like phosphatase (HAD superfamily)
MRSSLDPAMEDLELPKAAIFDLDGTLLDSVDLHALAWQEALRKFGHDALRYRNFEPLSRTNLNRSAISIC